MRRNLLEFLCVGIPKALAGVCTLALNVALLRFFGPEKYGVYALCISAVLVSDAILGSALDLGVIRLASLYKEEDPKHCVAIQAAGICLKLTSVLLVAVALSCAARPLSAFFFHSTEDASLIPVSCGVVFAMMLLRSAQLFPQIQGRFSQYGLLEFLQMTLKYGGVAALLLVGKSSPGGVLILLAAGPLVAVTVFAMRWSNEIFPFPHVSWQMVRELLDYVKWFFLTFSVAALVSRVDVFLLASWSNLREVGIFSAAQTFAYVPQLLGSYLSILLSPRVMPSWRAGRFLNLFRKFQLLMLAGCVAIYFGYFFAIKFGGSTLLPHSFVASEAIIMILLPGALAGLLTFPLTLTFLLFIRPRFLITVDCIALPIMFLLYRYAIARYGAVGAAWVTSSSFVIKASIAQIAAWKLAYDKKQTRAEVEITPEPLGALTSS